MKTIGNYDVKIFTDNVEDVAVEQLEQLLAIGTFSGCKIRVMPDVHKGAGCVIGFTGDLGDKVIPNIVGVDIGCGILVQPFLPAKPIDFHALNEYILKAIPSGRNVRDEKYLPLPAKYMERYIQAKGLIQELLCHRDLKEHKRLHKAAGTLGGGNHFIEVDSDAYGLNYLLIHTGSRNLGKQVAELYQALAVKCMSGDWAGLMERKERLIEEYKQAGRKGEIKQAIHDLIGSYREQAPSVPPDLCYLEGRYHADYLHDMRLCQRWAEINRRMIADLLMDFLVEQGYTDGALEGFESVHNYIGADNVIRKGAISARVGERCIIPLNMRDGALICIGKGNEDWNFSAPHGAGRVMSRSQAFSSLTMEAFKQSMEGIYSETVAPDTIDEAPMVYKPKEEIMRNIRGTVTIENTIKPIYNYKAAI